jgi:hypothetical protein
VKSNVDGEDDALGVVAELTQELLTELYNRTSGGVGESLMAVGLFPVKDFRENEEVKVMVTRLIRAGVMGSWRGILEEMSAIEKEQLNGHPKN